VYCWKIKKTSSVIIALSGRPADLNFSRRHDFVQRPIDALAERFGRLHHQVGPLDAPPMRSTASQRASRRCAWR
jgi:hypothetical protein